MTSSALDRVPAPIRRMVGFVVGGVVVYAVLIAIGAVLFPSAVSNGSTYALSSTVAAAVAAYYLVYLGGYERLRELLE